MADLQTPAPIISVLREIRIDAGLSLGDLEALTGINRGRLSILERGVLPTRAELHRIMGAIWAERMHQLERVALG